MMVEKSPFSERCKTGVSGLDDILRGGLPLNRLYVVQGEPGSGKTTMALQFLLEGRRSGEKALYITFSETREELTEVCYSHGWTIDDIDLIDLSLLQSEMLSQNHSTLFHPSEVELNQITEILLEHIEKSKPARIVFDSVSEMRLLAETPLRYRRQILALKQALAGRAATVLFLDDLTAKSLDSQVQSIAHGVIAINRLHHDFGGERRTLNILKLRGVNFCSGSHDFSIHTGGAIVYPRIVSPAKSKEFTPGQLSSGLSSFDDLVGGGLDYGTSNLILGPAGTGKSSLTLNFALTAANEGLKAAYFTFDETIENFMQRATSLKMDVEKALADDTFRLQKVDPAELSPGEFAQVIQNLVSKEGFRVIVIDSLNGYEQSMPQEKYLILQLHELLGYLNSLGVVTIMVLAQQGLVGVMKSPVDLTYLADTVILTRFFEAHGSVKKAVSVMKKRTGAHETTIREYSLGRNGIQVGPVLDQFDGILTGVPRYRGRADLLKET